jgi:putative protease
MKKEEIMEEEIGRITHYFAKVNVGILEMTKGELRIGDTIHVKGHTTDFYQNIKSMQMDHNSVESAKSGDLIGLEVENPVREKDLVFKVSEE